MQELKCYSASGQLGFGIPKDTFQRGVDKQPNFIGADMGSIDVGPYYLGYGDMGPSDFSAKRDLELILSAGMKLGVPVIIGSAGTSGGKPHLDKVLQLVREVASENDLHFKLAIIPAEIDKKFLKEKLTNGKIKPYAHNNDLTSTEIDNSERIVGQMGVEPFIQALEGGADVVLAGRACDTSIFTAIPLLQGFNRGIALHMAKIIECTSICAEPGGRDPILAHLRNDHFILESQNPQRKCTPLSVAAHSLYEQPDPYYIHEPGGYADLTEAKYEPVDDRKVKVWGAKWIANPLYTIKLEGAKFSGYRTMAMAGIRDPILIREIKNIEKDLKSLVKELIADDFEEKDYTLNLRTYGIDGVMGQLEPHKESCSHELFIIVDVVAKTPQMSKAICGIARQNLLHFSYPGRSATAGNLAFPFTPAEIQVGEVYNFNIYHLLEIETSEELFKVEFIKI